MQKQKPSKSPERQMFDKDVNCLLMKKGQSGLLAFINRNLKRFQLERSYDIFDIFIEGYIRGVYQIESGQPIEKTDAWLRGTCYNVIRELSKHKKPQNKEVEYSSVEHKLTSDDPSDDLSQEALKAMLSAIREILSPIDFEIFVLRAMEDFSWIEIEERLKSFSNTALRKRYERLKKPLRDYFFANALLDDYGLSSQQPTPALALKK